MGGWTGHLSADDGQGYYHRTDYMYRERDITNGQDPYTRLAHGHNPCCLLPTKQENGIASEYVDCSINLLSANYNYTTPSIDLPRRSHIGSYARIPFDTPPTTSAATAPSERAAQDDWKQIPACNNPWEGHVTSTREPTENKHDESLPCHVYVGWVSIEDGQDRRSLVSNAGWPG